ncbi:hypothetical protein [Streptomyces xiaopingdaonensis]|uniref:hypothetical protein n=1 Tax=Streptomyces xiaopingdaonensis TaxID=1565415 RepID=UPI0012FEEE67|nr:hypothetical protein [Streptomyces xiaopingdaonensis]
MSAHKLMPPRRQAVVDDRGEERQQPAVVIMQPHRRSRRTRWAALPQARLPVEQLPTPQGEKTAAPVPAAR